MTPDTFIVDSGKVLMRFGKWPDFHDMEIVSVTMNRRGENGPSIEFIVFTWSYSGRLTPDGFYEQLNHSLVRFRCERVGQSQFDNFNHQNVLDGLEFFQTEDKNFGVGVRLASIYGLGGELACGLVRVVDVVAANRQGQPIAGQSNAGA